MEVVFFDSSQYADSHSKDSLRGSLMTKPQ